MSIDTVAESDVIASSCAGKTPLLCRIFLLVASCPRRRGERHRARVPAAGGKQRESAVQRCRAGSM